MSEILEIIMKPEILEIIMIVSFGISWPMNVIKSYKARTTKGKSLWFILLILFGYIAGISSKLVSAEYMANFEDKWYVLIFYIINFITLRTVARTALYISYTASNCS